MGLGGWIGYTFPESLRATHVEPFFVPLRALFAALLCMEFYEKLDSFAQHIFSCTRPFLLPRLSVQELLRGCAGYSLVFLRCPLAMCGEIAGKVDFVR